MAFDFAEIEEMEKDDLRAESGRLFAYIYETGDDELKRVAMTALKHFYDKNILDFTVFRSAVRL